MAASRAADGIRLADLAYQRKSLMQKNHNVVALGRLGGQARAMRDHC